MSKYSYSISRVRQDVNSSFHSTKGVFMMNGNNDNIVTLTDLRSLGKQGGATARLENGDEVDLKPWVCEINSYIIRITDIFPI